jgi:hypothetical protein
MSQSKIQKLHLKKKDSFKINDTVTVETVINGLVYIFDARIASDRLEMVPEALQNVKVYEPPQQRKPREKKTFNYKECDVDDDDGVFDEYEDEFNPADWSDEISDEDDVQPKLNSQVDLSNNLNDSCTKLCGLSVIPTSKIDDLTQTTQSLVNLQQNRSRSESPFTNNGQIIAANRPGPPNSARSSSQSVGRTYFRQHLFNNIFKAKCSNAFTAVGIMDQPFDHFLTQAPVKVNEIIGKCFTLKEDQTKF